METAAPRIVYALSAVAGLDALSHAIETFPEAAVLRVPAPEDALSALLEGRCACALLAPHASAGVERGRVIPGLGIAGGDPIDALADWLPAPAEVFAAPWVYGLWTAKLGAPLPDIRRHLALASRAAAAADQALIYHFGSTAMAAAQRQIAWAAEAGLCARGARLILC